MRVFPAITKARINYWVLILALVLQFSLVFDFIAELLFTTVTKSNFISKRTYVESIQGDQQSVNMVKKSLDYFNSLGNNKIVRYTKPDKSFVRPITIIVRDFNLIEEIQGLAGYAVPMPDSCVIVIQPFVDVTMFELVLIHEYLHCFGYLHTDDKTDIMYPSYRIVFEANIRKYAKELEGRE